MGLLHPGLAASAVARAPGRRRRRGATGVPPERLAPGISLRDVSFSYPGTERLVLEHVDVDLPAGSVIAVVGENGAGKSTLVKLLAALYEPTAGRC